MKIIDVNNWNRKEHYAFFSKMSSPYFGIVTELDCTVCHEKSKKNGHSFFASYLHKSTLAANSVKELRYRIIENDVVEFDVIHAGTTIGREDGTFGFSYIPFSYDFAVFNDRLKKEIAAVKNSTGLRLKNEDLQKDLIRYSTFPWHSFSGLLNPTNFDAKESVPKIIFGKFSIREGKKMLPISLEAHHGLCDGWHLSKYLEHFQELLNH